LGLYSQKKKLLPKLLGTTPRKRSSAKTGGFNIKSLPAGVYIVTIKKPRYADQVNKFTITDGEISEINIQLTRGLNYKEKP